MKHIAIVTGASSGIGKEFFLSLNDRKEGLDEIWVIARSADKLEELDEREAILFAELKREEEPEN